jgi:TolA-binding protein
MLADLSAVAKGSGADAVLYDLAWAQRDAKDTASAQAAYRRLIQEHSDSKLAPAARTELAELLSDDKKYDEAAQLLEQVVSDKSADPKVLAAAEYRLGWCYEKLNKPDKAAAVYASYTQKGGGTDEMKASALLHAGLSFASDQKYDKAEQALSEMLAKYPNQKDAAVAMLRLGEVQAEQQKYDASARTYSQFLDRYPTSEFAYRARFGIAWALENEKQYEQARQAYEKVIAATNGETAARAQFQIGETWLAERKFEQAIPALLAVEDVYKYPKWSARALFEAGRAFEQLKQPDKAKQQYGEIVNKYKDAPEAGMAQDRLKTIAGS